MITNTYRHQFVATCPVNGQPIVYTLAIETTGRVVAVEQIVAATAAVPAAFHEVIADDLYRQFGGRQTLRAHHHGVDIVTIRGGA